MNSYGMELNAVVTWTDADDQKHSGVLVDIIETSLMVNEYDGELVEVPMSMVNKAVNPDGKKIRPNN